MTATLLLFDGYSPEDAALENSHWIAQRTLERLGDEAVMLTHPDAVRATLEQRLTDGHLRGLAAFGHGEAGRLHTALRMQHRRAAEARRTLHEASEAGAVHGCDGEPALDLERGRAPRSPLPSVLRM